MTWWRGKEHYEVFFNRDELKTRHLATPPDLLETNTGVRYLSPRDPTAGGTWMLVNEHQVTICLLNRWHEAALGDGPFESRGLLVKAMADCTSTADVMKRVSGVKHTCYRPFTLVAMDHVNIEAVAWNGELLTNELVSPPLTSSSYLFPEVSKSRIRVLSEFQEICPETLQAYQQGESPASAYTVRMNRPDAQTWSRSHVRVYQDHIDWEYIEEAPSLIGDGSVHTSELPL